MKVSFVAPDGVCDHQPDELPALLERTDGFAWVDVPVWDGAAEQMLFDVFGCHQLVVDACRQRNHVPTVHAYEQHLFIILHSPLAGASGHVHLLELCQIVGFRYIVTVHGPAGFFFTNANGGWEYPAFWAVALAVQALLGDGALALRRSR